MTIRKYLTATLALTCVAFGLTACRPGSPVGGLTSVVANSTGIVVVGWAFDEDAASPSVPLTVSVDSTIVGAGTTGALRPDYAGDPTDPIAHTGFELSVPNPLAPGDHQICVWAENVGPGEGVLVGCERAALEVNFDVYAMRGDHIAVSGWAVDHAALDTAAEITIKDYVGSAVNVSAGFTSILRPDVAAARPGAVANSGFAAQFTGAGQHLVCVSASVRGGTVDLGCRGLAVQFAGSRVPTLCCYDEGLMESAERVPGGIHVTGHMTAGSRTALPPQAVYGGIPFFVDGGLLAWDAAKGSYATPRVPGSSLLAAGVAQVAGVGFDAIIPTTRRPLSVCIPYSAFGPPTPPWDTLSCVPVQG